MCRFGSVDCSETGWGEVDEVRISIVGWLLILWLWSSWIVMLLARQGGSSWASAVFLGVLWPVAFVIQAVKVWRVRRA